MDDVFAPIVAYPVVGLDLLSERGRHCEQTADRIRTIRARFNSLQRTLVWNRDAVCEQSATSPRSSHVVRLNTKHAPAQPHRFADLVSHPTTFVSAGADNDHRHA